MVGNCFYIEHSLLEDLTFHISFNNSFLIVTQLGDWWGTPKQCSGTWFHTCLYLSRTYRSEGLVSGISGWRHQGYIWDSLRALKY